MKKKKWHFSHLEQAEGVGGGGKKRFKLFLCVMRAKGIWLTVARKVQGWKLKLSELSGEERKETSGGAGFIINQEKCQNKSSWETKYI